MNNTRAAVGASYVLLSDYHFNMLIFVYEHMNSGVYAGRGGPDSLHAEGRAMLSALLDDFRDCPDIETVTLLDPPLSAAGNVVHADGPAEEEAAFRRLTRAADRTLVIAPETDGILGIRCRWVVEENGRSIGPSAAAIDLAADKLSLAAHLAERDLPTPPTRPLNSKERCPLRFPVVVKPRDGAGSLATFRVPTEESWRRLGDAVAAEQWTGELIVQPLVVGKAASVAILSGPCGTFVLPPAEQRLSTDDRFRYLGGSIPIPAGEARRAQDLARRAVASIAGLWGFVGVDLVLGAELDGRGDAIIEINPRLTTSYIGLRELARFNLAGALLAIADGEQPPPFDWHDGAVRWRADGTVNPVP